jgi:hypothetical protein
MSLYEKNSISLLSNLETNDLTRQLAKKADIYNYYFSFLKLIGIWNKVRRRRSLFCYLFENIFSFMLHILIMEFIIQNKFYNNSGRNYNVLKLLLKQASSLFLALMFILLSIYYFRQSLYLQAAFRSTSRQNQVNILSIQLILSKILIFRFLIYRKY